MVGLTMDSTRPPERGNFVVILPDRRVILVDADAVCYAQTSITELSLRDATPEKRRYHIRIDGEMRSYMVFKTGSLKRVLHYLERRKQEKRKHGWSNERTDRRWH